jgi:hypothetical protein
MQRYLEMKDCECSCIIDQLSPSELIWLPLKRSDFMEGQSSAAMSLYWELRGTNDLLKLCARAMYINYPPFLQWLEGIQSGPTTAPHRR